MAFTTKAKQFFPLALATAAFVFLLVVQMALHGSSSSAGSLEIANEKAQAYEAKFGALKVETTKGTKHDFSKAEQPIVILNFWASWCRPCLSEFATLKRFVKRFGPEKVLVVGINNDSDNPKKAVMKVEKDLDLNFESVVDEDGKIAGDFLINEIPASIVFHRGKVIHFENREFDFMSKDFINLIEKKLPADQ